MKKSFLNQMAAARRWQTGDSRAFTFTELLVVLAVVAMLATVLLSASFTTKERALQAECVGNLRQIATGWNMYQQDFNQMMPCHWPGFASSGSTSNPWRTYEAGRVMPGTIGWETVVEVQGPWNLGLLFATGVVPNPRVFYCPSVASRYSSYSYDYYATVSNTWPSISISSGDDKIRVGYNYLPQGRKQVRIDASHVGPAIANGTCPGCTPLQLNDIDPNKSIATDTVISIDILSHRASGSVAGLNALFPDGRVVFQNARSNPQAFDPNLWKTSSDFDLINNNPVAFRIVMSLWQP
ncbi:MAG: type II secretion system protein [Verrucomicrobiota bacterium]|jgi:prepilin-type N-terminal cleavage/methylation domain-containing protein